MPQVSYSPSEKQISYIDSLMRDKEGAEDYLEDYKNIETSVDASKLIGVLRALPFKPRTTMYITQDGMYKNPETGDIYKVQRNKAQGDGSRLYGKILRLNQEGDTYSVKFEYITGLLASIKPEWKMTLAEAEQFGQLYDVCVRCGRALTREESIQRAMGPICAESFA